MATVYDVTTINYSEINAIDALLGSGPDWNYLTPQRNVLYYTFDVAGTEDSYVESISIFNNEQKSATEIALQYISSITGIIFVQEESGERADFHFAAGNIQGSGVTGLCAYQESWSTVADELVSYQAEAYIYLDIVDFGDINTVPEKGGDGYQVLLHELGHALGLQHPFDGPYTLPASTDTTNYTIMSYTWAGEAKSVYQEYDLLALQWLYGNDGLGGASGSIVRHGTSGDDTLTGSFGADTLYGEAGNDSLFGMEGNDILNGGGGNDTMFGGVGDDTYLVDAAGDLVTEEANQGVDTIKSAISSTLGANLEKLILTGTAAITGTGNALANTLTGNSGANILNGMAGNDTMLGGQGNDTYLVDVAGDVVTEEANQGIDTVKSTVSYTLGANVENLTLAGTTAINGIGNGSANILLGNSAVNVLSGGSGRDVLKGGAGNDTLVGGFGNDLFTGGDGKDVFVFNSILNAAANRDVIKDFNVVDDIVRLDQTVFTKLTTGALKAGNFRSSTDGTAADINDYILYNTTTGSLLYDADGSGTGLAAIQFVTLAGIPTPPTIAAGDFAVVA